MEARMSTETKHRAGRTRGGLCGGGGSGYRPPAPARPPDVSHPPAAFQLDDAALDDLKDELIYGQRLAVDEEGRVLVWSGGETGTTAPAAAAPAGTPALAPLTYTPSSLAEKNLTSRSALEGERKQVKERVVKGKLAL